MAEWKYGKRAPDYDMSFTTVCIHGSCPGYQGHTSSHESKQCEYTLCPKCTVLYNTCRTCNTPHFVKKNQTKYTTAEQWKCSHCKEHLVKCTAEFNKFTHGDASNGPAENPLNADLLIKRAVRVLKTYKSDNVDIQTAILTCVDTLVRRNLLEQFLNDMKSFSTEFSDVVEIHLSEHHDTKQLENMMQSFKKEEFVDAVYGKVLGELTELQRTDVSVTKVPEPYISQVIMDTASQYLDEVRVRLGHHKDQYLDEVHKRLGHRKGEEEVDIESVVQNEKVKFVGDLHGMKPLNAFAQGHVLVQDDNDSNSGESSELSSESASDEASDEDIPNVDTDKKTPAEPDLVNQDEADVGDTLSGEDSSDEPFHTETHDISEENVQKLQKEMTNIHRANDTMQCDSSDEDFLDKDGLSENEVEETDYVLITELGLWDFSQFFNTLYMLMNIREILLRNSTTYNLKSGLKTKLRLDSNDIWQRVVEAVYTSKANLFRYFVTMPVHVFKTLYPSCSKPYGSLTFPDVQCDGLDVQLTQLSNFNKHLEEQCLFRGVIQKLLSFFAGIASQGSRENCQKIYQSTLKLNDSEIDDFPSINIHDEGFWFDKDGELSKGALVYMKAATLLVQRFIASAMNLDEKKFNEEEYKPYYPETEVRGTQSVKSRMHIRSSEILGMIEDNTDTNSSRKCLYSSGKGIVPIWLAVEMEFNKATECDPMMKECKSKEEHYEGSAVMKQYSHVWLVLCFLHCVNARVGTLYYLYSGKTVSEDFECDKEFMQDASYLVINGTDFLVDFKNASSNACYFAREMCNRDSEIYKHSLEFFFNPELPEESRYNDKKLNARLQDFMQDSKKHLIEDCGSVPYCTPVEDIQGVLLQMQLLLSRFGNITESFSNVYNVYTPVQKKQIANMSVGLKERMVSLFGQYKLEPVTEKKEPKSQKSPADEEDSLKAQLAEQKRLCENLKLQILGLTQKTIMEQKTTSIPMKKIKSHTQLLPKEQRDETKSIITKKPTKETNLKIAAMLRAHTRQKMAKYAKGGAGGGSSSKKKQNK